MGERPIYEVLRDPLPDPADVGDIQNARLVMNEAADILEAFFEQLQCHAPYMDGNHHWRLRGGGWPMTHCKGPTREDAMQAVVAEIKRERESREVPR